MEQLSPTGLPAAVRSRTECPDPDTAAALSSGAALRVLVVEDDADVRGAAVLLLRRQGLDLAEAADPAEALAAVAERAFDAVLLDLNFRRGASTGEEGLACLADLRACAPHAGVVVVTAHSGVAMAVEAMRAGAVDFVTKPWSNRRLAAAVQSAAEAGRRAREASTAAGGDAFLGSSPAAARVRERVRRAGPLDASVLVWGPAGSGKSLVARLLYAASAGGPLAELDLAATALGDARAALAAAGGTLALSGVEALPPADRPALAAALAAPGRRVRLVAQSRLPPPALRDAVGGELFFRLAALEIEVPPLAGREDDAAELADHWLRAAARRAARPPRRLSPDVAAGLRGGAWVDDARGLRLLAERAALLGEGPVKLEELLEGRGPDAPPRASDLNLGRGERALVEAALKRWSFNVSHAARELGVTRATLYRRMAKHGL